MVDSPTENTEAETIDGIPDGNLNLNVLSNSRKVLNSTETVQPYPEAVDNSVVTAQTRTKKKLKQKGEKQEIFPSPSQPSSSSSESTFLKDRK